MPSPGEFASIVRDHGRRENNRLLCNYCRKGQRSYVHLLKHLVSSCPQVSPTLREKLQIATLHKGINTSKRRRTTTPPSATSHSSIDSQRGRRENSPIIIADDMMIEGSHCLSGSLKMPAAVVVHGTPKPNTDDNYLEEVEELGCSIKKIRRSWPSTGCSILVDGWSDPTIEGRDLVSFIVDCPNGPIYFRSSNVSSSSNGGVDDALNMLNQVVEKVGVDNVVQVVATSTDGWIEALGMQFMCGRYRKQLFWTTCASHNIHLMLERIGRFDRVKAVLEKVRALLESHGQNSTHVKSSNMNSVMSALERLENVVQEKHKLETQVEDVSFWTEAALVLKATLPLCRLLALIREGKMQTGYIYDAVYRAKEKIRKELEDKESDYMPFWKIIDDVWTKYLHNPLHAAGYYLNPGLFYSDDFECDKVITSGLLHCMVCLIQDRDTLYDTSQQLEKYRVASGIFVEGSSSCHRGIPPLEWWTKYGGECPELQKFAVRVLSQTCDGSSRYGLRRHIAERMSARRSPELHEDFVHYNMLLLNNLNRSVVVSDGHSSGEELSPTVTGDWMEC